MRTESSTAPRTALTLHPQWLLRGLAIGVAVLAIAHYVNVALVFLEVPGISIYPPVDLDSDSNLSTWYGSGLHLINAMLFGMLAASASGRDRARWAALGVMVLLVSADEIATVHERVGLMLGWALDTSGVLTFAWVIPAAILVTVGAFAFTGFLVRQPAPARLLLVGAGVFLAGAMGVEMVTAWWFDQYGFTGVGYHVLVGVEETLEMTGCLVAMRGLLGLLAGRTVAIGHTAVR